MDCLNPETANIGFGVMDFFSFYRLGEAALVCSPELPQSLQTQQRIWQMVVMVKQWPEVVEIIPGMNNLTLIFDPAMTDVAALEQRLTTTRT